MNKEVVFKVNTKMIKKIINEKYGGVPNFTTHTKYSEKSIYLWLQSGVMKTNALFEIAEILNINDLNLLKKKEVITWHN